MNDADALERHAVPGSDLPLRHAPFERAYLGVLLGCEFAAGPQIGSVRSSVSLVAFPRFPRKMLRADAPAIAARMRSLMTGWRLALHDLAHVAVAIEIPDLGAALSGAAKVRVSVREKGERPPQAFIALVIGVSPDPIAAGWSFGHVSLM